MNETPPNPRTTLPMNTVPRMHLIDLTSDPAGHLCAIPRHSLEPTGSTATPIPLPSIPMSTTTWLMSLSTAFRQRTGRCLAALLLFDPTTKSWGTVVPRQQCSVDSVCWSLACDADSQIPPHALLAGSWQMRAGVGRDELIGVVPALPGIHFVVRPSDDESMLELHAFICVGDETYRVSPEEVTLDDWQAALHEAQHRIVEA